MDHRLGVGAVDRSLDVGPHHLEGDVGVGPDRRPERWVEGGQRVGDVEPAVCGEAGEEHVAEAEDGGGAAGGDVLHAVATTRRTEPMRSTASRARGSLSVACTSASRAMWVMKMMRASPPKIGRAHV